MTYLGGNPKGPDSVTIVDGTLISGTVNDVAELDGVYLQIEEVSGTPGFDVIFDFSELRSFSSVMFHGRYEGNPSHEVFLQMWDYSGSKWVDFSRLLSDSEDSVVSPRVRSNRFFDNGNARVRFLHTTNGSTSHDLYIDLLSLRE